MAKLYNLAAMTVGSTGTGTITLGAAATINGVLYLSFAAAGVANGETVAYSINDVGGSEVGTGVYTSSGTTLTRVPVTSTNGNAAINMTAAAIVRISPAMADIANLRENNVFTGTLGANSSLSVGATAIASPPAADSANITGQLTVGGNSGTVTPFSTYSFSVYGTTIAGAVIANTSATSTSSGAGIQSSHITQPSAANHRIGFYVCGASNGTSNVNAAGIFFYSSQAWSAGNQGMYVDVATTPTASSTRAASTRFQNSGGVSIGATAIASDPGIGCLSIDGSASIGTTVNHHSYTVATLPSGAAGKACFASDCRVNTFTAGVQALQGAAAGTGSIVAHNGTAWQLPGTNITAQA